MCPFSQYRYPSKNPVQKLKQRMVQEKFRPATIKSYAHYLEEIINFTQKSPKNITSQDIINYLENLVQQNKSRSTLNTAHSALKYYFEHILRRHFFYPQGRIARAQLKTTSPSPISPKTFKKILYQANQKYRIIFQLMYYCGLTSSEITNLKVSNIDLSQNTLKITKTSYKWQKRTLTIPQTLAKELKNYLKNTNKPINKQTTTIQDKNFLNFFNDNFYFLKILIAEKLIFSFL